MGCVVKTPYLEQVSDNIQKIISVYRETMTESTT